MNQADERNAMATNAAADEDGSCHNTWPAAAASAAAGGGHVGWAEAIIPVCQRMWRQDGDGGGGGGGGDEGAPELIVDRRCLWSTAVHEAHEAISQSNQEYVGVG